MKVAAVLTENLLADNIISKKEVNIINYGLESLIGNIIGLLVILVIGAFFDHIIDSLIVWLLAFPLRKYAGGFHARTRGRCLITSMGLNLVSYIIFFQCRWKTMDIFLMALTFSIIIFFLAPVGTPNKPLDKSEKTVYRRRTREFLVLEEILLIFALCINLERLVTAITICFFMVGMSLLAGKVKSENYNRKGKKS